MRFYFKVIIFLAIMLVGLTLWHYQPWRVWQAERLAQQLGVVQPIVREQALHTLHTWPLHQQQRFLRVWQDTLLATYETAINQALLTQQLPQAQSLLADLQRLYPELPSVQLAQQQLAIYSAQKINPVIKKINELLAVAKILSSTALVELQQAELQLQSLAPNHALLYDQRILYLLLAGIDQALAENNWVLAQQQMTWGLTLYPTESALLDRKTQLDYKLAGRPAQSLERCLQQGRQCWQIHTALPLLSPMWLLHYQWLRDWQGLETIQAKLGEYYRQQALFYHSNQQLTLAAVSLLRAAYFTPPDQLNKYWEWLAFAFKERDAREQALLAAAQLSALQHTFLTQISALDVVNAQRSLVAIQEHPVNLAFVQQVAFPLLGEVYLKLAQQLAAAQRYQLAIRLLLAGQDFLPRNPKINSLLAEYQQLDGKHPFTAPNVGVAPAHAPHLPINLRLTTTKALPDAQVPTVVAANRGDPCLAQVSPNALNSVSYCQDQLASSVMGPPLIIPPATQAIAELFAISKYPVTLHDYNYYCRTTKACKIMAVRQTANRNKTPTRPPRTTLPGNFDLADVAKIMDDYDAYCRTSGNCSSIEPQAQDIPVTNIPLNHALDYAAWLSAQTGYRYRLPTVLEWEYSILANTSHVCSANTLSGVPGRLLPVQQAESNAWHLAHELANMREWIQTPDGVATVGKEQPQNIPLCALPIRQSSQTGQPAADVGFRLVREIKLD